MITEDYCSLEVAKLLKEKGFVDFDAEFYRYYDEDGEPCGSTWTAQYPRLTHQMAMKWLREKHIIVTAQPAFFYCDGNCSDWRVDIWCDDNYEETNLLYKTYEEAIEAGLKYVLTNFMQ